MKPFNFAETKLTERAFCGRQISRNLRLIGAFVIAMALVTIGSYACRRGIGAEARRVNSSLAVIQLDCTQARRELESAKATQCQNVWQSQLSEISGHRLSYLNAVIQCAPGDIWLSRVMSSEGDTMLTVDGKAVSFEALSTYTSRLRLTTTFEDVRIANTAFGKAGSTVFVDFSLNLKLKPVSVDSSPASNGAASASAQAPIHVPDVAGGR